jgi:hypothetical protein
MRLATIKIATRCIKEKLVKKTSTLPSARQYMRHTHLEMVVANATTADARVALNQDGARLRVPALHVEVALLEAQRLRAKTSSSVTHSVSIAPNVAGRPKKGALRQHPRGCGCSLSKHVVSTEGLHTVTALEQYSIISCCTFLGVRDGMLKPRSWKSASE